MLPSSRRMRKNNIENDEPLSLGAVERFYKKTKTTTGATDARDNSKIKRKYSKTNLYDNGSGNGSDEDELNELTPSYIESEISNNLSLYVLNKNRHVTTARIFKRDRNWFKRNFM